jgi:hypothetical protein
MLFIKHFATFIFTFELVFGSIALAMPTKGDKPDNIKAGRVYQARPRQTVPQAGSGVCYLSHTKK